MRRRDAGARARRPGLRLLAAAALVALVAVLAPGPGDPPAGGRAVAVDADRARPGRAAPTREGRSPAPRRPRRGGLTAAQLLPYASEHVRVDLGGERGGRVLVYVDHDVPRARARAVWGSLLARARDRGDRYLVAYRPVGARAAGPAQRAPLRSAQAFAASLCAFQRGALPAAALAPATRRLRSSLGGRPPGRRAGVRPRAGPARLLSRGAGRAAADFLVADGEAVARYRVSLVPSRGGWAVDRLRVLSVMADGGR